MQIVKIASPPGTHEDFIHESELCIEFASHLLIRDLELVQGEI